MFGKLAKIDYLAFFGKKSSEKIITNKSLLQKKLLLQVLLQNWKFEQGLRQRYTRFVYWKD